VLGLAGYGIRGYGDNDTLLGKPGDDNMIEGLGNRLYVKLRTLSANSWNINTGMVAATGSETACAGDSGGGAFPIPSPDSPTSPGYSYTILGVTSAGDYWCRATNTFTRVGTTAFWAWLDSVKQDITENAVANNP